MRQKPQPFRCTSRGMRSPSCGRAVATRSPQRVAPSNLFLHAMDLVSDLEQRLRAVEMRLDAGDELDSISRVARLQWGLNGGAL